MPTSLYVIMDITIGDNVQRSKEVWVMNDLPVNFLLGRDLIRKYPYDLRIGNRRIRFIDQKTQETVMLIYRCDEKDCDPTSGFYEEQSNTLCAHVEEQYFDSIIEDSRSDSPIFDNNNNVVSTCSIEKVPIEASVIHSNPD